jgi:hypothetical protein
MRDPHKQTRKESSSNPTNQTSKDKAPKIHKRKSHRIHKQITTEHEEELKNFHTSCGKIHYKEASNLPTLYPLEICIKHYQAYGRRNKGENKSSK